MRYEFKKFVISIVCFFVLLAVFVIIITPLWEGVRFNNCRNDVITATRSCTNYALSATQNTFTDDGTIAKEIIGNQTYYNGSATITVFGVDAETIYEDLTKTDPDSTSIKPSTYRDRLTLGLEDSYLSTVGDLIGRPLGAASSTNAEDLYNNASTYCNQPFYTPTNFNIAYINDDLLKSQLRKSLLVLAQSQTTSDGDYQWVFDLNSIDVKYYTSNTYETEIANKLPVLENFNANSGGANKEKMERRLKAVFGDLGGSNSESPLGAFQHLLDSYGTGTELAEQFNRRWDLSWYTSDDTLWNRVPTYYVEIRVPWYYITRTPSFNVDTSRGGADIIQNIRTSFANAVASGSTGFTTPTKLLMNTDDYSTLPLTDKNTVDNWCDFWNTDPTQILIDGGTIIIRRTVTGLA